MHRRGAFERTRTEEGGAGYMKRHRYPDISIPTEPGPIVETAPQRTPCPATGVLRPIGPASISRAI